MQDDSPPPASDSAIKRSASVAGLNEQPYRPAKKRAPKACQSCRSRKVRCNVSESGPPCINCRLDEVECTITESKRKRRTLPKPDHEQHAATPKLQPSCKERHSTPSLPTNGVLNFASLAQIQRVRKLAKSEHVPHPLYQCHDERTAISNVAQNKPALAPRNPNVILRDINMKTSSTITSSKTTSSTPSVSWYSTNMPTGPSFLTPVPLHVGLDETTYLQKKNALSIPEPSLRDAILRAYAEFVHPLMPILDLRNVLRIVHGNDGKSDKLSVLLFQAVMFAGSNFVEDERFLRAGYTSRNSARESFLQKTRLLYDFDYEQDPLIQVQALLLMTWTLTSADCQKDAWHWMGVAVETAHTIGLHRASYMDGADTRQQGQARRIWWSLVIRDRLMALEYHRPMRIRLVDSNVPMLSMDDFQLAISSLESIRSEVNFPSTGDITTQRSLAAICIEQARLCDLMNNGTTAQSAAPNPKPASGESTTMQNMGGLDEWRKQLPHVAQLEDTSQPASHCNASVIVNRSFLHMVYLTATANEGVGKDSPDAPTSDSITEILSTLTNRQLIRYLPPTSITILTRASLGHLQGMTTSNGATQKKNLQAFAYCAEALRKIQQVYPPAHASMTLLDSAVKGTDLSLKSSGAAVANVSDLLREAVDLGLLAQSSQPVTPPPDDDNTATTVAIAVGGATATAVDPFFVHPPSPDATMEFDAFATLTPPSSYGSLDAGQCGEGGWLLLPNGDDDDDDGSVGSLDADFDSFINVVGDT